MPLFLLLQHTGKVFPDKRKANPVWNERLTHSLEWQSGVTSLIHCEMKAVYVWQSGRKQFLIIAVPSHIKVQIVLFTVLQTNKILHKTPFFLGKKKKILKWEILWTISAAVLNWAAPSAFPAKRGCSWVTLQAESLPASESPALALLCWCESPFTEHPSLPPPSLPTLVYPEQEERKGKKQKQNFGSFLLCEG